MLLPTLYIYVNILLPLSNYDLPAIIAEADLVLTLTLTLVAGA
jgi:hypothetical protein